MKARTIVRLVIALLAGVAAAVATLQLTVHSHGVATHQKDDEDTGLTP